MEPLIPPQANAILQIAILAILSVSIGFNRKKRHWPHGALTLVATILNLFSFMLVMLPSALAKEIVQTQPFHIVSIVILSHTAIGAITVLLGVWLVTVWHMQSTPKDCFKRKKWMRLTIVLWMLTFILGFLLYAYLYTTLIP